MRFRSLIVPVVLLVAVPAAAAAGQTSTGQASGGQAAAGQGAAPPPARCNLPQHRQFDFWIGEWDVSLPDGSKAGVNRIESILDGCALRERWTGASGGSGQSLNIYDRSRGVWHQTWVDAQGSLLRLEGRFAGGKMTLQGETRDSAGPVLNRIVWQEAAPGRVRQLWELSRDGGKTWTVAFDGRYVRR